jgi:hypothetical protein
MDNQKSAFMPSLISGLLLGIVLIVYSLILYITELNENVWLASISYVLTAVVLFFAITNFRDKDQNGFLSYGKGVSVGTLTGLFASFLLAIFTYVYVTYIDPSIIEQAIVKAEESILERTPDISDEDLERGLEIVEMVTSPAMMAVMSIFWYTIVSLVFSLIISIFAKREDTNIA